MITQKLYVAVSFLSEFSAEAVSSRPSEKGFAVVLNKTAFFPEGVGQPSDIGEIENAKVFDVQIENGEIVHYCDMEFIVGQTVNCRLDFDRRFDFMQQHSGEHIVSGIVHSLFGFDNVGFHLSDETVTLDFNGIFTDEQIEITERKANEAVWKDVAFKTYYPEKDELANIFYRSKKELEGDVRIVEIEGVDSCACCAPHVKKSGQIGLIKLLDSEKLRGGTRFQLKCGGRALKDYNEKYHETKNIGGLLSAKQNEVYGAVLKLNENLDNQIKENLLLKKKLLAIISEGNTDTAIFAEDLDMKSLQQLADRRYRELGGLRAVFSKSGESFAFALCGEAEILDEFFKIFKEAFSVRGGGRGGLVQGTVIASIDDLKSFFQF